MSSPSTEADPTRPTSSTAEAASNALNAAADTTSNAASQAAESATNAASSAGDALANVTAKALGDSSYTAHQEDSQAEQAHSEIPKATHPADVPDRIQEHPQLDQPPKVAEGDSERPAEPELQGEWGVTRSRARSSACRYSLAASRSSFIPQTWVGLRTLTSPILSFMA